MLFRVQLRFTFDLCKMHSTQLLNLCCTSGSLTIFTADVRHRLHWLALQQRVEYKVSLLAYNCLHQAAPSYLAEMCVHVSATDNRCHLRSATHGDLAVPRVRQSDWLDTEEVSQCWSAAVFHSLKGHHRSAITTPGKTSLLDSC